ALWQIVTSSAHVFFSTVGLCGGFLKIAWLAIFAILLSIRMVLVAILKHLRSFRLSSLSFSALLYMFSSLQSTF
ncbi:unnamed protein product, partial [Staurois parvus]